MALERIFECPRTLSRLHSGPLENLLEGFCNWLLEHGFRRGTIRKHLFNVFHLNEHLGGLNGGICENLHTTAMHLLRAGNDVNMVSYRLGHADINTTHIYVEIDMKMKRKMLQKAGPPAVKKPLPWQKLNVLQWLNSRAKLPQF